MSEHQNTESSNETESTPLSKLIALLCHEVTDKQQNDNLRSRVENIFDDHVLNEAAKEDEPVKSMGMKL